MLKNKYFYVFVMSFSHSLKNIKSTVGLGLFLVICLIVFANLWEVLSIKTSFLSISQSQLLWYIALNEWILIAIPRVDREIQSDFESGRLQRCLNQPISYLGYSFFDALGTYIVNLIGLALITLVAMLFLSDGIDLSFLNWLTFVFLAFFSGVLGIIYLSVIGLFSFWVHDTDPLAWIWEKLLFALGGLILPLSLYPDWIQKIANYSPFSMILGGRSALIFNPSWENIGSVFTTMAVWFFLGIFFMIFLYRKGIKNLMKTGD